MNQKKGVSKEISPKQIDFNGYPIPEDIKSVLEKLPEADRMKLIKFRSVASFFSGPLPSPEILEHYSRIIPDGADRIMRMAENQSTHRIKIEDKNIDAQIKESKRGQIFGLIIAIVVLMAAVGVGSYGHELLGSILGGTTILGLVTLFLTGRHEQKKLLAEKRPNFKSVPE